MKIPGFIGVYSLPPYSLRHARHKNVTLHYISRTKRDKKPNFSIILYTHIRSKPLKSEISIFIILGGVGGQIPPPPKSKFQHNTRTNRPRATKFYIYTPVSYIIIPIKYENPILKSPGIIGVSSLPPYGLKHARHKT